MNVTKSRGPNLAERVAAAKGEDLRRARDAQVNRLNEMERRAGKLPNAAQNERSANALVERVYRKNTGG